ncbi:MAG: hypothetical protein ACP5NW_03895 [Candidatus Woesearchaeota archaeon]
MNCKRGQFAGNAAAFIAILTVMIILYILFLPPDIRTELLGDKNAMINGSNSDGNKEILLEQNVGKVTYINTNEKTYDLPSIRIYSPTEGQVLKNIPSMTLRSALFDTEGARYETELNIERDATKNIMLSFSVREHQGPISIELNGVSIYNGEILSANPRPITLNHEDLLDSNTLTFSVPLVGLAFWKVNKYTIENLQVTGDVTDYSNALAVQHFVIGKTEKENLESVKLSFYPSCNIQDVGSLRIDLNGKSIYNGLADCGVRNTATLDVSEIISGSNELRFYSTKGSYTLDNMYIKTTMTEPVYKIYYFDMDETYFSVKTERARCGDYDNNCPSGCDETEDADCCFNRNGFWCALPTLNFNDRCRFYVSESDCGLCKTGYYDRDDDAPERCQETCGDNEDDECPAGCTQPSRYYDRDCCYAQDSDNYWCQETPITGISDKCKPSVSPGECDLCPSGYKDEDGRRPESCTGLNTITWDDDYTLLDNYELKLVVRFIDNTQRKRVDFNINGHTFRIDTTGIEYTKIIDDFAEEGTNSIEIKPVNEDVEIAEIRVELREV